jgi:hypothetical protein
MVFGELIDIVERYAIPLGIGLAVLLILAVPPLRRSWLESFRKGKEAGERFRGARQSAPGSHAEGRGVVQRPCPNDNTMIPLVAEHLDGPEPVRFYWCRSCGELFAFVGDTPAPGRWAAAFAREHGTSAWRMWKTGGSEQDVRLAVTAVTQVEPPS